MSTLAPQDVWESAKEKGNDCYAKRQYHDAIDHYISAIKLLKENNNNNNNNNGSGESDEDLAKLYSNKSVALYKLYVEKKDGDLLQEALKDAQQCVQLNPKWEKGYFR